MNCGRKSLLGAIVTIILGGAVAAVYFFTAFSLGGNQNDEADLGGDSGSANYTALRGNATASINDDDMPEIEPEIVNNEIPIYNATQVEEEGEFFVTDKEEFTLPPTGDATTTPDYPTFAWSDLPNHIKSAASRLGFTEETWDSDEIFSTVEKRWSDMSRTEKNEARVIGFNKWTWNNCAFQQSTDVPTSSLSTYPFAAAAFMWDELPEDIRSSAEYLGYTEDSWDVGEFLPLLNTKWGALTAAQRSAAEELGFDQKLWNDATR